VSQEERENPPATAAHPDDAPTLEDQGRAASGPDTAERPPVDVGAASATAGKAMPPGVPARNVVEAAWDRVRDYFVGEPPTFWVAMVPLLALAAILYTRHPQTNFIFDEQEALLGNPYVNGKGLGWLDAFRRDFWGLPHDRSIGSYRPIPDLIWRVLWLVSKGPWLPHWINVLFHAANGSCLVVLVQSLTKRPGLAWMCGLIFTACAVITEAVSGVVGISDVLGGLGAMLALLSLTLPLGWMPVGLFLSVLFSLFSKESGLVLVPLVPFAALVLAPLTHPEKPRRWLRLLVSAVAAVGAFVLYVQLRKHWFPAPMEATLNDPLPANASVLSKAHRAFMVWFHQPPLPKDPLNNPLIKADTAHRVAGGLRVFFRGVEQVVVPKTLSGDYSFPQEPIPDSLYAPEIVLGAVVMAFAPLVGLGIWLRSWIREAFQKKDVPTTDAFAGTVGPLLLVALGLVWFVVSFFPHSNIPVLLPTVRAERFWYFPAIGTSLILGVFFVWLFEATKKLWDGSLAIGLFSLFIFFQCGMAFRHSRDYRDDLAFWSATRDSVPNSAKAHLNLSVMYGARNRMDLRLSGNTRALELAPEWPMAHVYLGDTLCRMHRPEEAWPHYQRGFVLAENDPNLLALGMQCLWDEQVQDEDKQWTKAFKKHEAELDKMADERTGTWLAYFVKDMIVNGDKNNGVEPKYRPRGYNEPPKE
jgi:hypothetical protein